MFYSYEKRKLITIEQSAGKMHFICSIILDTSNTTAAAYATDSNNNNLLFKKYILLLLLYSKQHYISFGLDLKYFPICLISI